MTEDDNLVFRRGQVEWALWRSLRWLPSEHDKPPKVFATRVKRLLELDVGRPLGPEDGEVWAFIDASPTGHGRDIPFTLFNAFCLALGLDLLDVGFKQSEVVFLMRHLRGLLEDEFPAIMDSPPVPHARVPAVDRPGAPTFEWRGQPYADCRVFLVIDRVEIREVYEEPKSSACRAKTPLILEPVICLGLAALQQELDRMNFTYRTALVIELAETAVMVTDWLRKAPTIQRGRKAR